MIKAMTVAVATAVTLMISQALPPTTAAGPVAPGQHFHDAADAAPVTGRNGAQPAVASSVRYYGFVPARISKKAGNHLPDVRDRSNLNWVEFSDRGAPIADVLKDCAPASCMVSTGYEFFSGCSVPHGKCVLHPDAEKRWRGLADELRPHMLGVGAFYLLDEPYLWGASAADLSRSAQIIRASFPGVPVMMTLDPGSLDTRFTVPPEVDWVGFDHYCVPIAQVAADLRKLKAVIPPATGKKIFLFPQGAKLNACGVGSPDNADGAIAQRQWDYLRLAESDPQVIGLLSFGLWMPGVYPTVQTPADLPLMTEAQKAIAARILGQR
jgi:hypothetical protein